MRTHPNLVRRYVSLNAPWLGTGRALTTMLTGDTEDLALNYLAPINELRVASQFMPGLHQLLPNKGMFDQGFRPVVELGWDLNHDGTNFQTYNYSSYVNAMETNLFTKTHAEAGLTNAPSPSRARHENFHKPNQNLPIANASTDGTDVETHQIISLQAVPRSIAGVRFLGRLHRTPTNIQNVVLDLPALSFAESEQDTSRNLNVGDADGPLGVTTNQFRLQPELEIIRTLGDGAVPALSLARGFGSPLDYNVPHSKLHCLASDAAAHDQDYGHLEMLNHPTVRDWLGRILTSRRTEKQAVTLSAPGTVNEGSTINVTASAGGATVLIDFGDGGSGAIAAPSGGGQGSSISHRYLQNGTYTITAGATTSDHKSGFASRQIVVANVAPVVQIEGGDITVAQNETRIVVANVTDPGLEDSHTFIWKLDDQVLPEQHSFATAINFVSSGTHTLTAMATDSDGATGQGSIQIVVQAGVLPAGAPPGFSPAGAGAGAAGPLVFEQQPAATIRITGLRSGLFGLIDTKGATIREGNDIIYEVADAVLPVGFSSIGPAISLASSRRVFQAAVDTAVQRTFSSTEVVELRRRLDAGGDANTETKVDFFCLGGPLEVELSYTEGGVPQRLSYWSTNLPALTPVKLKFNWSTRHGTLSTLLNDLAPVYETTDPIAAADRQPPTVVGIFNPATGNVTLVARDNFTPADKIQLFLVQDTSGDGKLDDEVFYELKTNVLVRARMPSRKFAIVGRDGAGNVTASAAFAIISAHDYTYGNSGTGGFCDDLTAIRSAVRENIVEALGTTAMNLFLIERSHLWVFEQGSGACLWKPDSCAECNGNFVPGLSDNDYQLFLPAHLERNYQFTAADRAEFLASNPYETRALTGDWYFKRPIGLDASGLETSDPLAIVNWHFQLPPGFALLGGVTDVLIPKTASTTDPANGLAEPLTPAEIIAFEFTRVLTSNADRRKLLPQTTFFPVRREHFMFGKLDLDLPPPFGDDPLGDAGAGRQLLLLKWALEGAFVGNAPNPVNQGTPSLEGVYQNVQGTGVPVAEGLEWGLFQEFAALNAGVAIDLRATYGPADHPQPLHSAAGNDLEKIQRKKLKSLGKAAIRAALARLAGDPATTNLVFGITRQQYLQRHLRSYEDFILAVIHDHPSDAETLFGEFAHDRPIEEGPDLEDFLELKRGNNETLYDEIFKRPGLYKLFVLEGLRFLRTIVQQPTLGPYNNYLDQLTAGLAEEERAQRARNLHLILQGDGLRPGLIELRHGYPDQPVDIVVAINNYASVRATSLGVTVARAPAPAPAPAAAGALPFFGLFALAGNPPPGDITIQDAEPVSGSANDDPLEEMVQLTEPLEPGDVEKTEITATPPSMTQESAATDSSDDNHITTVREEISVDESPPPIKKEITLFVDRAGGPETVLEDWPASLSGPRSPRYLFRRADGVKVVFRSAPDAGPYQASVTSDTDQVGVQLQLAEKPPHSGNYQASVRITDDPNDAGAIQIIDEETLRVQVQGPDISVGMVKDVMVDRAEYAAGGIKRFFWEPNNNADLTFQQGMRDLGRYYEAGIGLFSDNVASQGNPMRTFILNAGDNGPENRQADVIHITAHGSSNGNLFDDATPSALIFDPDSPNGFIPNAHWNQDVEWATIDACLALSTDGGSTAWERALNGSPRNAHGVLGFFRTVPSDIRDYWARFHVALAVDDKTFVDAFREQMSSGPDGQLAWAALFHTGNGKDRLFEMTQDNAGGIGLDFNDRVSPCGKAEDCCGDQSFGTLEPTAGQLRVDLSKVDVPAHLIPSSVRLRQTRAFPTSTLSREARHDATGAEVIEFRKDAAFETRSTLDPTNATEMVKRFVATHWTNLHSVARLKEIGVRRSKWMDPARSNEAWVKGYQFTFELLHHGVPVWNNNLDISVVGNDIQRAAVRQYLPSTNAPPAVAGPNASPSMRVLPPQQALRQALNDIKRELNIRGDYEVVKAELYYVPQAVLGQPPSTGDPVYLPAWRFVINPNYSAQPTPPTRANREWHDVWIGAADGQFKRKGVH